MMHRCRGLVPLLAGLALLGVAARSAHAQGSYMSSDRFGYTGQILRYNSLDDLQAGTNAVAGSPFAVPQRDMSLFFVANNAGFGGTEYANTHVFMSNWVPEGTPSNSNYGFVQMWDLEGGSVLTTGGEWLNPERTIFHYAVTGGNTVYGGCDGSGDCGRLWNAGSPMGSAGTTAGVFLSYVVDVTAFGLAPAVWNPATGVYESNSEATAVTGHVSGIFHNTATADPGSNGWYAFDLQLNMQNWAYDHEAMSPSWFGAETTVPEPASMTLLVSGLAGLLGAGKLRRRRH